MVWGPYSLADVRQPRSLLYPTQVWHKRSTFHNRHTIMAVTEQVLKRVRFKKDVSSLVRRQRGGGGGRIPMNHILTVHHVPSPVRPKRVDPIPDSGGRIFTDTRTVDSTRCGNPRLDLSTARISHDQMSPSDAVGRFYRVVVTLASLQGVDDG